MQVSIIIITKNRPKDLYTCLYSILGILPKDSEVIVLDQSENLKTKRLVQKFQHQQIKYYHQTVTGKSKGLNFAVSKASFDILLFTDDDCIVSPNWVTEVQTSFQLNPNQVLLFGKTLPFNEHKNQGLFCPSQFQKTTQKKITLTNFSDHATDVGIGNNMAIKKSFFSQHAFKEWLGPGSKTKSADDTDIIIQALISNKKIGYSETMIIYHNRWLNKKQTQQIELEYLLADFSCYGYYALQAYSFAQKNISRKTKNLLQSLLTGLIHLSLSETKFATKKIFAACTGSLYALYHYTKLKLKIK